MRALQFRRQELRYAAAAVGSRLFGSDGARLGPLKLVDTDPVFTQVDHLQDAPQRAFAQSHNAFFTFGECFGRPGCTMPDDGLPWQPTRQPVTLKVFDRLPIVIVRSRIASIDASRRATRSNRLASTAAICSVRVPSSWSQAARA